METGLHFAKLFRVCTLRLLAFSLVFSQSIATGEGTSDDGSMLCISKCGTCPVICSQSPPPPSPLQIYILPNSPPPPPLPKSYSPSPSAPPKPSKTYSPPPPPSENYSRPPPPPPPSPPMTPKVLPSQPTPPAGDQERGGISYPYYYFYTAGAGAPQLFVNMRLWLFTLVAYFVNNLV